MKRTDKTLSGWMNKIKEGGERLDRNLHNKTDNMSGRSRIIAAILICLIIVSGIIYQIISIVS